jgi:hypothetical protein
MFILSSYQIAYAKLQWYISISYDTENEQFSWTTRLVFYNPRTRQEFRLFIIVKLKSGVFGWFPHESQSACSGVKRRGTNTKAERVAILQRNFPEEVKWAKYPS